MGFVDRPQRLWWRQALFQIHLWTGVMLALYAIAIGASGSAIVFADRITDDVPVAPKGIAARRPLSLVRLAGIARSRSPASVVTEIQAKAPDDGVYRFELTEPTGARRYVYVAPSGTVFANVSGGEVRHALIDFLVSLHSNLLGGRTGSFVNGIFGCGLALLAFSGIVLWWPGRSTWRRALAIKLDAGKKRLFFDLHTSVGFWSFGLLVMFSLTGAALAFYAPWTTFVAMLVPVTTQPVAASSWRPGETIAPLDVLVREATRLEPALHWDLIEMPGARGGQVIIRLKENGVPLRVSRHAFVYLDPRTSRILKDWRSIDRTFGDLVTWYAVEGLHYGDFTAAVQYLWVIFGLIPVVLSITSIVLWWNRVTRWRASFFKKRGTSGVAL